MIVCLYNLGSELKPFQPTATKQSYLKHYHKTGLSWPTHGPPIPFFPLVIVRHVTETDNLHTHTQVTQHKHASTQVTQRTNSRNRQKTVKIVKL